MFKKFKEQTFRLSVYEGLIKRFKKGVEYINSHYEMGGDIQTHKESFQREVIEPLEAEWAKLDEAGKRFILRGHQPE